MLDAHFDILSLLTPEQRSRIDPDSARRCSDPPVASLLDCCPLGQALGPPPYVSGYPSPDTVAQILEPTVTAWSRAIEDAASRFITWWDGAADDATLANNRTALVSAIKERTL